MSDMENHLLESMKSSAPSAVLAFESDIHTAEMGATSSSLQTYSSRSTMSKADHRDLGLNLSESSDDDE
uniref:SNX16 n=1 Tax=Heterorhabditis bacteriophora TaxID=37862 RepID=A0A1I7WXN0_HETBA